MAVLHVFFGEKCSCFGVNNKLFRLWQNKQTVTK